MIGGGGDGRRVAAGGEGGDLRRRRQHVQVHPALQGLQQTGGRNFQRLKIWGNTFCNILRQDIDA